MIFENFQIYEKCWSIIVFKIILIPINSTTSKSSCFFEKPSVWKNSSTFRKLIYSKNLIYFSKTHLLQKTHLLLRNSSTSKNSSTSQKLIYFLSEGISFQKKSWREGKRKRSFWTLISRSFFFVENDLRKNTRRGKKNKATNIETLPNKYLRETHVPYFKKILEDEESYGNLNERLQMEEEVARYSCLDILGLRLELDKAVKWLYNTSIWNCFELLLLEAKFAFAYRTFRIEILASSKVKT